MSTIAGVCGKGIGEGLRRDVNRMCGVISLTGVDRYFISQPAPRAHICASASLQVSDCRSATDDDVTVVVCGEVFDCGALPKYDSDSGQDTAELIRSRYRADSSCQFLREMDGEFVIAVLDRQRQVLHLASDRLGTGRLYVLQDGGRYWFCSSPSGFAEAGSVSLAVDDSSAAQFLEVGYFLGNRTWLKDCSLLSPGTIWSIDLAAGTTRERPYWTWRDISPADASETIEHAASTAASLLRTSVARRCRSRERMTITLSGGLDSRALLAAALDSQVRPIAFTFGKPDSLDVRLAARVARLAGVKHAVVEIGADNWLQPRIEGVWATGGELSLLHMHCVGARSVMAAAGDANLNGHAGGLILGGAYLVHSTLDRPLTVEQAVQTTGASPGVLRESIAGLDVDWKTDWYFLQNRVRRFTSLGAALLEGCVSDRKPFVDRRLLEFVYSLPDSMRFNRLLYRRMLLSAFPELFARIPWEKTGVPIGWSDAAQRVAHYGRASVRRFRKLAHRSSPLGFANYGAWLCASPANAAVERLLMHPNALYAQFCDSRPAKVAWSRLPAEQEASETVCRYLTMELWLQQAFEGRFRTWDELALECGLRP